MKVAELFPRKSAPKKDRGGLTPGQAVAIEKEFAVLMEPLDQKATEYFRGFQLNGGQYRFWILPNCETWRDISIEHQRFVLRYKEWFVSEIQKQELDKIPM